MDEFRNPAFVAYVRIPARIVVDDSRRLGTEYGKWIAVWKSPHPIHAGRYVASWQKFGSLWKITSETYTARPLGSADVARVLRNAVTIHLGGTPDWLLVTPGAVWVANDALHAVQRVAPASDALVATVRVPGEPCSGLAAAFGSVWVPLCGPHPGLARIDPRSNTITALLPFGPALSEGGITAGPDSVWLVTRDGILSRIDPVHNRVRQTIRIARGSYNPLYSDGTVWITSGARRLLTAVDARSAHVVSTLAVGSKPRFLAAGHGAIWTLDQGDGSISKVDAKHRRLIAVIHAEIPGGGGEIAFGANAAWATIIGVPLTSIDAARDTVQQWEGRGGDAVRFGDGAVWLTDYFNGRLFRIPISKAK